MKIYFTIYAVALLSATSISAAGSQELAPLKVSDLYFAEYYASVIDQLSTMEAKNWVSAYCFPAHRREWIIQASEPSEIGAFLRYAEANDRIWGDPVRTNVGVIASTREIPVSVARDIREIWELALAKVAPQHDDRIIRDGEYYFFSIDDDLVGTARSPSAGTMAGDMVSIVSILKEFILDTNETSNALSNLNEVVNRIKPVMQPAGNDSPIGMTNVVAQVHRNLASKYYHTVDWNHESDFATDDVLQKYLPRMLDKGLPPELTNAVISLIKDFTSRVINDPRRESRAIDFYIEHYSENELMELLQFSDSPLGRKSIDVYRKWTAHNTRTIDEVSKEHLSTLIAEVEALISQAMATTNTMKSTGDERGSD